MATGTLAVAGWSATAGSGTTTADAGGGLVISEVMAANSTTIFDEDGAAADWIEVHNTADHAIDLAGWRLTDKASKPDKFTFPSLALPADGYVLVFADNDDQVVGELHADFAIDKDGEYLGLSRPDGTVAFEYAPSLPAMGTDQSYGIGSSGAIGFLQTPTPGAPNSDLVEAAAATPVLDRAGGYVDGPVTVHAQSSTAHAQLYYTTDGSTPSTTNGTATDGTITVEPMSILRVVAIADGYSDSEPATATFLSTAGVLAQHDTPSGWPDGPVNDQRLVYGFDPTQASEHGGEIVTGLQALPTLSIVTDQANLTDPTTGIYVNAGGRGAAWDRAASVELLHSGGTDFQAAVTLSIKGGFSRTAVNPKHGFRLEFAMPLDVPVLGTDGATSFMTLDLRTEQNASWQLGDGRNTMLREAWTRGTQAAAGDPALRSRSVQLFLNGQYWGVYQLEDRLDADGAAATYGGSAPDYDVIKTADDLGYEVQDGDDDEWRELWSMTADQVVTDAEYARIEELVDLDDLADFQLINAAAGNLDAAPSVAAGGLVGNNWTAFRSSTTRFRFVISDAEYAVGAATHDVNDDLTGPFPVLSANPYYSEHYFNPGWLHQALLSNAQYRAVVASRAQVLLAGVLSPEQSAARWAALKAVVEPAVWSEAARWGWTWPGAGPFTPTDWATETAWVEQNWFPARTAVFREQVKAWTDPLPAVVSTVSEGAAASATAVRLGP